MTGIGLNIDGMFLDNQENVELLAYMEKAKPDYSLVLNSVHKAIELKPYVKKNIIYRHMFSPEYNEIWRVVNPKTWWDINIDARNHKLILHTSNEPSISTDLINFEYTCGLMAHENKQEAVLLNFSVGTPEESDYGKLDPIFELICDSDYLYLGLHEYAATTFQLEFGDNLWDYTKWKKRRDGYVIGRYNRILDYTLKRFGKKPKIIFTEFGFDTIHALLNKQQSVAPYNYPMGIRNTLNAFTSISNQPQNYAGQQLKHAWKNFYQDESIKGVCYFCFGGVGVWKSDYNLAGYKSLLEEISEGFNTKEKEENKVTIKSYGDTPTKIRYTGSNVNIRDLPTTVGSKIIGQLNNNNSYYILEDSDAENNGYKWKRILYKSANGIQFGWCAISVQGFSYEVIDDVVYDLTEEILLAQELYNALLNKR